MKTWSRYINRCFVLDLRGTKPLCKWPKGPCFTLGPGAELHLLHNRCWQSCKQLCWAEQGIPTGLLPVCFPLTSCSMAQHWGRTCASSAPPHPLSKPFFTTDSLCWKAGGRFYLGWNHFKALFWWSIRTAFNPRQRRDHVKQPEFHNWNLSNINRGTANLSRCYNIYIYPKTIIWVIRTVPDTLQQIAPGSPQKCDPPLHKHDYSPSQTLQERTKLTKKVPFFFSLFLASCLHFNLMSLCAASFTSALMVGFTSQFHMLSSRYWHCLLQPCKGLHTNPILNSLAKCVKVQPPPLLLLHCEPARWPCPAQGLMFMALCTSYWSQFWSFQFPSLKLLLLLPARYFFTTQIPGVWFSRWPQKHNCNCLETKLWWFSSRRHQV